jgi:hypothetical protein
MTAEARPDPETLMYSVMWQARRLLCSPEEYQRLFEDIATRAFRGFVRVEPYGREGDWKCDGFHPATGTVYQVYSPDEMKASTTRSKIETDLSGAVAHWGEKMRRWVFVFNVRRGVAPHVLDFLLEQRTKYPAIEIALLSSDDLWQMVRALPQQDRAEILGTLPGYGDTFSVQEMLATQPAKGRFLIVQDVLAPIDLMQAVEAIEPNRPFAPPLILRPSLLEASFEEAAAYQRDLILDTVTASREQLPRFAVFSLAPIPLVVHAGFILSDLVSVEAFQYHRDRGSWRWEDGAEGDTHVRIYGLPSGEKTAVSEVVIRVSLSATISKADTRAVTGECPVEVDITIERPDVMWLRAPTQIIAAADAFRSVLATLRHRLPQLKRIHLFYAGPTPVAVALGQAINPRMNAPVVLYEYHHQKSPRYERALELTFCPPVVEI